MTDGPRSALDPRGLALLALGGAAGATVRWAVLAIAGTDGSFPWWTLLVNVVGCLLLGLLLGSGERTRLALGVGFCGGLTTFSTFTVEIATLLDGGSVGTAAAYVVVSSVLGTAAVGVGWRSAPAR